MEEEIVRELHVWHGFNCFPSFPLLRLVLYSFWSLFFRINVMPRRIPDFPDSFHSWNFLSSIGSGITFLSFAIFSLKFKIFSFRLFVIAPARVLLFPFLGLYSSCLNLLAVHPLFVLIILYYMWLQELCFKIFSKSFSM